MQRFWDKLRRVTLIRCFKCLKRLKHWNTQSEATHCIKKWTGLWLCSVLFFLVHLCTKNPHLGTHVYKTTLHGTLSDKKTCSILFLEVKWTEKLRLGSLVNQGVASLFTGVPKRITCYTFPTWFPDSIRSVDPDLDPYLESGFGYQEDKNDPKK